MLEAMDLGISQADIVALKNESSVLPYELLGTAADHVSNYHAETNGEE
jgi:hypothetical protein